MLLQADASQLEWRTILELARDWVGISEIVDGDDVHSNNEKAFKLPSRLIAKIYLFRTIFRGSGWSFANDPDFMHVSKDPQFWDNLNEKFYKKYYGIADQHQRWADEVVAGRPIQGPLGRAWTIGMNEGFGDSRRIPWTMLSNYPVQGTGADVMMLARVSAHKRIKALGIPCDFVSTVHDSIVVDTRERYVPELVPVFHAVFADIPKNIKANFGYEWIVPMACECKTGMNMKEMKKVA